ncbi:MAG TPA: chemotaxis protein CheA, partial [Tepidisphaeraceae bacterium]|nr:chemotaxis protein CheA [Tepidisphaeraceae bacterium]
MPAESTKSNQFVVEAREHLAGMTAALIAIERGGKDPRAYFEQLLRSAHSIKGGAGFIGRHKIEQLAHLIETAFENMRDGRIAATPEAIDRLLGALDRIGGMIDDLEHSERADITELLARLQPLIESASTTGVVRVQTNQQSMNSSAAVPQRIEFPISENVRAGWQQSWAFLYGVKLDWFACEREFNLSAIEVARRIEEAGTVLDSRIDLIGPSLDDGLPVPPLWYRAIVASELDAEPFARRLNIPCAAIIQLEGAPNRSPKPAPPPVESKSRPTAASTSLRISVPLIDRMMELAGELALVRNQAVRSTDPANAPMRRLMRRLDSVTDELQSAALRMRMQPVSNLFDRFPRLVRDLARQLGKEIELDISGSEVELDKTVLEILTDPLTHLIRNCCDHGIELPEQRTSSGKSPSGRIKLSARQDRGQIVIEVRDDGKGLDPDAIKRKAIEQGIKRKYEIDALSERQLYDLILLSGFSTASQVTDISGRGVGMDVVKTNLDQAGGIIEIDSSVGSGTIFTLR